MFAIAASTAPNVKGASDSAASSRGPVVPFKPGVNVPIHCQSVSSAALSSPTPRPVTGPWDMGAYQYSGLQAIAPANFRLLP